jgi:hypothetical protein
LRLHPPVALTYGGLEAIPALQPSRFDFVERSHAVRPPKTFFTTHLIYHHFKPHLDVQRQALIFVLAVFIESRTDHGSTIHQRDQG